jgi:hypothetical protein
MSLQSAYWVDIAVRQATPYNHQLFVSPAPAGMAEVKSALIEFATSLAVAYDGKYFICANLLCAQEFKMILLT